MSDGKDILKQQEVEKLVTSIKEMAGRVGAEFVVDQHKMDNYLAATKSQKNENNKADKNR